MSSSLGEGIPCIPQEEESEVRDVPEMIDDLIEAAKDLGRQEAARAMADSKCRKYKTEVEDIKSQIETAVMDLEMTASIAADDIDTPPDEEAVAPAAVPPTKTSKK